MRTQIRPIFWKRTVPFCLLNLLLSFLPLYSHGQPLEHYRYREQTNDTVEYFDWLLEKTENFLLTASSNTEIFQTVMDNRLQTRSWTVRNPSQKTFVEARRQQDSILLTGRRHGKPIHKVLQIDAAPWYQAMSISLRTVLDSQKSSMKFWTLRPDELTPLKLKAIKKGKEILHIGDRQVKTQKIEIRLTGLGGLFGHSLYWFRCEDGLFLQYQGPRGVPGIATTMIILQQPVMPVRQDAP